MSPAKIFIVDDDVDFADSLAETLKARGHTVELAHSGEDAIRRFRETDFDLAFMDVKLPGKNGVESFLEIRKEIPDVRVMMMTGYSVKDLLDQAIENGALGILDKPLDLKKVFDAVADAKSDGIVILVDDDADFSESIKSYLTEHNLKVFLAKDGQQAVESIRRNKFDALILDLNLPFLSGLEVYLELKKTGHVIPTILITGYAAQEHDAVETLKKMSVTDCLLKPFHPERLLDEIEKIMDLKNKS